jgi:hypothetical protein
MVSTTDALFCTLTESGGCSAAEQLASLQGFHQVSSIMARQLNDFFTIRFRIGGGAS